MGSYLKRCGRKSKPLVALGLPWIFLYSGCTSQAPPNVPKDKARVEDTKLQPTPDTLRALLSQEDTDSDRRITVLDQGPKRFAVALAGGGSHEVVGTYHLANLVQELYLRRDAPSALIPLKYVEEPIAHRISRLIRERYWDGLTRRIDEQSLDSVLADDKTDGLKTTSDTDWPEECTPSPQETPQFLYIPHGDDDAYRYYSSMRARHASLVVCRLPKVITPGWVQSLNPNERHGSRHGLLSLALGKDKEGNLAPLPYGVPGGRFNEMYGWDTYFHIRGLLSDGKLKLAQALADNQLYEVRHYGKVLNANRTYYLTRSQPPFLSSAVRAIWQEVTPGENWLADALPILEDEYWNVWNSGDRLTPLCQSLATRTNEGESQKSDSVCLAAYHAAGLGEPPEVEPGHFDWLYKEMTTGKDIDPATYRASYARRELPNNELQELDTFFLHDRSMRESGHDTTYRWTTESGDECANFATIDLNALLFKYELDLAFLTKESGRKDWKRWCERASSRQILIQEYLYDGTFFVDHYLKRDEDGALTTVGQKSSYISATTLFPLWASAESPCKTASGTPLSLLVSPEQAQRLVSAALKQLEAAGGLVATAESSLTAAPRNGARQWDFPFGWAPHQILAWEGLHQHGFDEDATRLTYRWLSTITKNAHDYHGTVPEKYNVVERTHLVFAEYGNVGTEFSYITPEGFGWMNASFQLGLKSLDPNLREKLNEGVEPEELFTADPDPEGSPTFLAPIQ